MNRITVAYSATQADTKHGEDDRQPCDLLASERAEEERDPERNRR